MLRNDNPLRPHVAFLFILPALLVLHTGASAVPSKMVVKDMSEVFTTVPQGQIPTTPAVAETTIKHEVFFDDMEALAGPQGWGTVNFRAGQPTAWNRVTGTHSCVGFAWWCGQSGFTNGDGYGNNWVQTLTTVTPITINGTSGNKLTFKFRQRSEYGFDYGWVLIHDGSTTAPWDTLGSYSGDFGSSCSNGSLDIPDSYTTRPQPIKLQFIFGSDLTVSAADSAGGYVGWSLDDVKVTAAGNNVRFFDDMEGGSTNWASNAPNPGTLWHLENTPSTPTSADCDFLSTNVWVPFDGIGFGQVPDHADAMLTTPPMDLAGVFTAAGSTLRVQFDNWTNLPFENAVYWALFISGSNDLVTWTPWANALHPLFFTGGVPQCIEGTMADPGGSYINFDPYNTNRTGIQPGTRYIKLGFRIRDSKATDAEDGGILRLGFNTEGIYFDNIGVYYVYTITGVETVDGAPVEARATMRKVYPNPFNPRTTIEFSVPRQGRAVVRVFDVQGRQVAKLLDEDLPAGVFRVKWNGTGDGGNELASGVYHAVLESAGGKSAKRLIMLK